MNNNVSFYNLIFHNNHIHLTFECLCKLLFSILVGRSVVGGTGGPALVEKTLARCAVVVYSSRASRSQKQSFCKWLLSRQFESPYTTTRPGPLCCGCWPPAAAAPPPRSPPSSPPLPAIWVCTRPRIGTSSRYENMLAFLFFIMVVKFKYCIGTSIWQHCILSFLMLTCKS